ncbi:MAG TPA: thioredoxin [Gaiellaceae bacterium]|nr:thioredoxin [Gaiellaceae bacterium]
MPSRSHQARTSCSSAEWSGTADSGSNAIRRFYEPRRRPQPRRPEEVAAALPARPFGIEGGRAPFDAVGTFSPVGVSQPQAQERIRMSSAVTESTFEQEVLKSDTPVIVDFWAEWCGPCHAVSPVLDRIAEERAGAIKVVKVNIDEEQGLAERYGIASIPTMVLFKDGEPAAAAIGAQPKGAIEKQLGLEEVAA